MARNLAGRRVVLTGASSGIGRCMAEQLAQAGAHVALAARSADKLDELAHSLAGSGTKVFAVPTDITVPEQRQRLIDTAVEGLGGIDVLINNAGIASWGHFATADEAILRQIMEVNFFAPVELIRVAVPQLMKGDRPAVVNVASMCGRRGMPAWPEYSASKFALVGLSEALRCEFARFDIDVLLVLPGLTKSDFNQHLLRNEGRLKIDFTKAMPPEQVAARILKALRRNQRETVIGWDAKWMLRMNRLFPRMLDRLIARKVCRLYQKD